MSTVLAVVRILILAYGGYLALLFVFQRGIAFPGTMRVPERAPETVPGGVEQIWLETSFGPVESWFLASADGGARPVIVFAHGNGELIDDWSGELRRLTRRGVHVLAVEYPGYGHSAGSPTRATLAESFRAAFDAMRARPDVEPEHIVAWGRSMGGGPASDLTGDRAVRALILQSTFSSASRVAHERFAPGFLVRDRFDVVARVRAYQGPVLLLHGRRDEVVSFHHAERIAAGRDDLVVTEIDCGHNDCGRVWPDIVDQVVSFLRREGIVRD